MVQGVGVEGSSVVLLFPGTGSHNSRPMAANDNGLKEQVKTVTVRRKLEKSGIAIKIKVPVAEFTGVSVSTQISEEGILSSAIELVHPDPDLTYRVYEEEGNRNVVAEWQNWGRKLRLPLFIRTGDGDLMPYSQHVDGVLLGGIPGRRKTSSEAGRRPRFLNRRKPGSGERA